MLDSRFNCVAIFDAIPDGELSTGIHLRNELEDMPRHVIKGLSIRYYRIVDREDLVAAIAALRNEVVEARLLPWIHLDAHGLDDESGFITANKNIISWRQLKALVTPLNIETKLNLVMIFASCFGASFVRAIDTTDRSPVLGLIGPIKEVSAGQVDADFPAFYRVFFEQLSLGRALAALTERTENDLYYGTTAEIFFLEVWKGYRNKFCGESTFRARAKKIRKGLIKMASEFIPSLKDTVRIMQKEEPRLFEQFRDMYFMHDLVPGNCERFAVNYAGAQEYAAR